MLPTFHSILFKTTYNLQGTIGSSSGFSTVGFKKDPGTHPFSERGISPPLNFTLTPGSSLAMARDTVLADCSCSRTPGSSLAAARCSDSCSLTPGSSLAAAHCSDSCSLTPGSALAAARCSVS